MDAQLYELLRPFARMVAEEIAAMQQPAKQAAQPSRKLKGISGIMEIFKREGIMSDWFLYCDTAFRISPPLVISEEEVRDSAAIIRRCMDGLL